MIFGREGGGGWEELQVEALLPFGEEVLDHSAGIST